MAIRKQQPKPQRKPRPHWGRAKAPRDLSPGMQRRLQSWTEKLGKQEKIHAEKILSHPETKTALGRLLSNSKRRGSPFYFFRSILTACVRCRIWEAASPKLSLKKNTIRDLRRLIPKLTRAFLNEETRGTTNKSSLHFRALLAHSPILSSSYTQLQWDTHTIGEMSDKQVIDALKIVIEAINTYGPSPKKKYESDVLLLILDQKIREHLGGRPLFASIAELMGATFGTKWDQGKVLNHLKYLRKKGMDKIEYSPIESPSLPNPLSIP